MLRSAAELFEPGSPGVRRRPLTSTSVRWSPRLRRLAVAVPLEPLDTDELCVANDCGRLFSTPSMRVAPCILISCELTAVTGLEADRFGDAMREPVTTISPPCA